MNDGALHRYINTLWYGDDKLAYALTPLSCLFAAVSFIRKHKQQAKQIQFSAPIIVVGNITVGGTGKTPMVETLVKMFQENGYKVGVASRGYHGNADKPTLINQHHTANDVGDEPLLIYQKTQAHVIVGSDRLYVINELINNHQCDMVICDDGLQDYRFKHTIEIIMVDGERVFGNRQLLPAGPLRESIDRIQQADFVVATTKAIPAISSDCMKLNICDAVNMLNDETVPLNQWKGKTVHAIAGIGNPQRFFNALKAKGLHVIEHEFADHASLEREDVIFSDQNSVFMTEKDAIKCSRYNLPDTWSVPGHTEHLFADDQ